jgi:hypothetical protein
MQRELVARIEELLREELVDLGEDVCNLKPEDYAQHMSCQVFSDESMIYAWKGMDVLRVVPEKQADGVVRWRMFTGVEAGYC